MLYFRVIDPRRDAQPSDDRPANGAGYGDPAARSAGPRNGSAVRWALRQPTFWALTVSITFYIGASSGLIYHLYPLLLERGFDTAAVVGGMALIGPAQVAGRIGIWALARRRSVKTIGRVVVLILGPVLLIPLLAPAEFTLLAMFAVIYGAANGIMTIVRGLALREMLTEESYGALNGLMSAPATIAKALSPFALAWLWSASGGYDSVLIAAILCCIVVAASFWMAGRRA